MVDKKSISGFSKLSKIGKIKWVAEHFFYEPEIVYKELSSYWHKNENEQKLIDGFSENSISNFHLPYSVAPNFMINGKTYCIPMVIEESSVVAAASSAAKYWMTRGGFTAEVINTTKIGQLHFKWSGDVEKLKHHLPIIKEKLIKDTASITKNMDARGGGMKGIKLIDWSHEEENLYQLEVKFDTKDSMGANFINSVLEQYGKSLADYLNRSNKFNGEEKNVEIILAILSNYTPECVVKASVSCPIDELANPKDNIDTELLAEKFRTAINIAKIDSYRATTHNKGIFNGIDAVVLATGNDFRAIEACGHAYASRDGVYRGLSDCKIEKGMFHFSLELPIAVGTVGGLTTLHPMAKRSMELLGNPNAEELMCIIATAGLAQNFGAIRSLITSGIQKGHMKMHLQNILLGIQATEQEQKVTRAYFKDRTISHSLVTDYVNHLRKVVK